MASSPESIFIQGGQAFEEVSKNLGKTFLVDSMAKDNTEMEQKGTGSQTQEAALPVFTPDTCVGQPLSHVLGTLSLTPALRTVLTMPPGLSLLHCLLSCQLPPPTPGFTVQEYTSLEVWRHTG